MMQKEIFADSDKTLSQYPSAKVAWTTVIILSLTYMFRLWTGKF